MTKMRIRPPVYKGLYFTVRNKKRPHQHISWLTCKEDVSRYLYNYKSKELFVYYRPKNKISSKYKKSISRKISNILNKQSKKFHIKKPQISCRPVQTHEKYILLRITLPESWVQNRALAHLFATYIHNTIKSKNTYVNNINVKKSLKYLEEHGVVEYNKLVEKWTNPSFERGIVDVSNALVDFGAI